MPQLFRKKQRGFTLVELMIALTIGLMITLAVTAMFLSQRDSYQQNEAAARMQENARFALELITQDLRHAGFFGDIADPIDIQVSATLSAAAANDCAGGIYAFSSPENLLLFGNRITDPDSVTDLADCVATSQINSNGSSILVIKRTATTTSTGTETADHAYTYANGSAAQLFTVGDTVSLSGGDSWEYQPRIYYLDDDNVLQRRYMSDTTGTLVSEPLAEGIEAFHIEFGIDTDNDGTPNYFYAPTQDNISDATLDGAVSASIYILARTPKEDRNYNDSDQNKVYRLGNANSYTLGPFNDGHHRRLYSTTTSLKNIRSQIMLKGL